MLYFIYLILLFYLVVFSVIPVLKIILVSVSKTFELNHFSIIFCTVSEFLSVSVSIKSFRNHYSSVLVSVFTSFQFKFLSMQLTT